MMGLRFEIPRLTSQLLIACPLGRACKNHLNIRPNKLSAVDAMGKWQLLHFQPHWSHQGLWPCVSPCSHAGRKVTLASPSANLAPPQLELLGLTIKR